MKTILVVEDEVKVQDGLEKILYSIEPSLKVLKTAYASEALKIAQSHSIDAFLLDIQLLDYSGMKLGEEIRNIDRYKFTPIIFITAVPTKEIIAFKKLHSYDYIVKPFTKEEVVSTMETVINYYKTDSKEESKVLQLKQSEIIYNYRQDDIIYIESRNRKLIVNTIYETATFTKYTLKSIEKELDDNFVRCHKGFIVNVDYIQKLDKKNCAVHLRNTSQVIPIGRKFSEGLKVIYK